MSLIIATLPSSFFGWVGFILEKYGSLFLKGSLNTLIVALSGTIIGFIIGLLIGVLRTIPTSPMDHTVKKILLKILDKILAGYIFVFRGTPMMVQAMVIYYGSLQYLHITMSVLFASILIISVNTGAYMAEIMRGGIMSVDQGQFEGSHSLGMTHWQTMTCIVLPQAIRNSMPSIGNEFIVNIKDSSVLNVISMSELFFISRSAAGAYLRYFEVFFITGIIYLTMTATLTFILKKVEKKLDGPINYQLCYDDTSADVVTAVAKEEQTK